MKKNLGLLAILALFIVVVALSGCSNNNTNKVNDNSTKVAIFNNGNTWAQIELIANGTHKNGTNITVWAEAFIKPKDNVTIDFSELFGYGDKPLPAGTIIRVQSWKGLFNNTTAVGDEGTLNLTFQGWSLNRYPTPKDNTTNVTFNPITIYQLPSNINDSIVFIAKNEAELAKIQGYDTADQEPVYEEEIIIVNDDLSVTIIITRPPELCRAIASLI